MSARAWLLTVWTAWSATLAAAADVSSDPFAADRLSYPEKRIVQAALELSGDYLGLLDGNWGKASQSALERFTIRTEGTASPRFADLAPLLAGFIAERDANGWRMIYDSATDMSYAFPSGLLGRSADPDVTEYESPDQSFNLIIDFSSRAGALAVHRGIVGDALAGTEPYASVRDDRLVSSAYLPGNLIAYVRSDASRTGYLTISIIATAANKPRVALLSSSIQRGSAPDFDLPASGLLSGLMAGHPAG